ncbi:MAG TPA: hypothetical protein VIX63_06490 [Vicinamibacterales bacterium]
MKDSKRHAQQRADALLKQAGTQRLSRLELIELIENLRDGRDPSPAGSELADAYDWFYPALERYKRSLQ